MYSVVDLFAGAGGLSLGFTQTGQFEIKVAYENNKSIQDTYKKNHANTEVFSDVCSLRGNVIQEKFGEIDVVIGGPPCQGFSNANRQKNHLISKNNSLIKEYVRAICELQPKAFVMENVSMLRSKVHRFYLNDEDRLTVEKYHIPTQISDIPLLDEAFDGGEEILRDKRKIEENLWDKDDYTILNVIFKSAKKPEKFLRTVAKYRHRIEILIEKYKTLRKSPNYIQNANRKLFRSLRNVIQDGNVNLDKVKSSLEPAIMIQRMLIWMNEIYDNGIIIDTIDTSNGITVKVKSVTVCDYLMAILTAKENGYAICNGILCAADFGAPQKRKRFVIMGIKKEISTEISLPKGSFSVDTYRTVREAISDIEDEEPFYSVQEDYDAGGIRIAHKKRIGELASVLRDCARLHNHIITATKKIALQRFKALKQGQNFHALDDSLKTTYSDVMRTQNTIYLRIRYDEPSGTVVNVRKSMWIHPIHDRAISIREAARLQTFPDSFIFYGSKDGQYQQVGNAVPPIMARAIAEKVAELLSKSETPKKTTKRTGMRKRKVL